MKIKKKEHKSEIPTSSMADIAFLLLVFFMVTTQFINENGLFIELPSGDTSDDAKKVRRENITEVLIQADGSVAMRYMEDFEQIKDMSLLAPMIRQKIELKPDHMIVLI